MTKISTDTNEVENNGDEKWFLIPIISLFGSFKAHIDLPDNNRVLFSAKFGKGKTYFLRDFFKKHGDEYFPVHLHTSRYQIASNEKIIDYIKVDTLISILESSNYPVISKFKKVINNLYKKAITKKATTNKLISVALSFGETVSVMSTVLSVINEIIKKEGVITEESIKNELEKIKEKKKVLIVDDLDRLDPDNVFRICNVFSVFVGDDEEKAMAEKLGFDTVIFVADYSNLKSIFHHRYGPKTDSQGYFDKLYSTDIFEYDQDKVVHKYIQDTLRGIATKDNENSQDDVILPINKWISMVFLDSFLRVNELNLRQLLSGLKYGIESLPQYPRSDDMPPSLDNGKRMQNTISFLIKTIGSKEELIRVIEKVLSDDALTDFHESTYLLPSRTVGGNYIDALRENVQIISDMIESFDSEDIFSAEVANIRNKMSHSSEIEFLDALKRSLILYLKEVHQSND